MTSTFMDFAYAAHALTELILGALKLRGRYAHEAPGSRSGKSKMYVRHHAASLLAHALLGALVLHAGLVDTRVGQGASLVLATFHGGAVGAAFTAFAAGELPSLRLSSLSVSPSSTSPFLYWPMMTVVFVVWFIA